VTMRRLLLGPHLQSFGASRSGDTCVFWTGATPQAMDGDDSEASPSHSQDDIPLAFNDQNSSRSGSRLSFRAEQVQEPDFVSFPPQGICPLELLAGSPVPTWTILPSSRIYQPTDSLEVRMWRIKLIRTGKAPTNVLPTSSMPFLSKPLEAERLEELKLTSVRCDCSAKGNSFCIIFRPEITRVREGDQFEVELRGLRGAEQPRCFFYDFHSFTDRRDHSLIDVAKSIHKMLNDMDIYKEPLRYASGFNSSQINALRQSEHDGNEGVQLAAPLPELGLVSHTEKVINSELPLIIICLCCPEALAIQPRVLQVRAAGNIESKRMAMALKLGDHFLIRIKLPAAFCTFELSFLMVTKDSRDKLQEHPWKYTIMSAEGCACPMGSLDHPLYERFGFCPVPAAAQVHGATVMAPLDYNVRTGVVYFMVHIHPEKLREEVMSQPTGEMPKSLLWQKLEEAANAAEREAIVNCIVSIPDPLFQPKEAQQMQSQKAVDPVVGGVRRMLHEMQSEMGDQVQDSNGYLHFDLAILQHETRQLRYVVRLQQQPGFPEVFDGLLPLQDQDIGSKIELYMRITRGEGSQHTPLKIGEWTVSSASEMLPSGL